MFTIIWRAPPRLNHPVVCTGRKTTGSQLGEKQREKNNGVARKTTGSEKNNGVAAR